MDIFSGVFFGTVAMMSWGASDFFVTKSARGCDTLKAFFWSQIVALVILGAIFPVFFIMPTLSPDVIILLILSGMFTVVSNISFYRSLEIGKVSIVMPIASCWAVVTVIISIIILNESLTKIHVLGVALAVIGAILVSVKWGELFKRKNHSRGVNYAVIAAIFYGCDFVIIDYVANRIGWFLPIFIIGIITASILFVYAKIGRKNISFPYEVSSFVILVGILDTIAYLSYSSSVTMEFGAVVAPIAATSPALSIVLAKIFFKEKLEINQLVGVFSVIGGLILLAI